MKKFALIIPLSLGLSIPAYAESERVIDPADVTKVYTQTALMVSGSSDIQFQGQVSGGMDNGQQFALLAEATFVDDNDESQRDPNDFGSEYSNSRIQYFHVFETGAKAAPKVGLSLDYINTRTSIKNDLLSVGGVVAINPAYTGDFLVFPRAGLMTGSMEIPAMSSSKDDLTGYSLGLITAKHLGDSGAYVSLVPEWQDLSGSNIDMQNFSFKTSLNVPMNTARTWWLNTRYDITKADVDVKGVSMPNDWQTEAWVGVRYYF
ncbi:Outer membrane protein with beta-barrel domain [Vibrio crassostreae]|nr:Outer membrane protein with beta-barrel domain [Vibrio crassostreae]CAK2352007.1 Outer membrane protein with beta-barrel domain [Vibrio crassostreae]CAK2519426.1 Outer membrane protein with beta-barrel domain [Vibrio crassostreae]CAK2970799.1 Outer membrane protein with beta-barrel domain [Vibrio crassostreae]